MLHHSAPLDVVFHALGDPTRRWMIERLAAGPASVSQLAEPLPMSLSAVGQHLAVLEKANLVRTQKIGRVRTCSLDAGVLTQAETWINARRVAWERRLDALGDYLAETKPETET